MVIFVVVKIFIKYLNEYNVISGNNVILQSLKEAMYMSDLAFKSYIKESDIQQHVKHYKII